MVILFWTHENNAIRIFPKLFFKGPLENYFLSVFPLLRRESRTADGADVLFTGKEFFVGISSRTNEAGARALAAAFPEYVVSPVIVRGPHQVR